MSKEMSSVDLYNELEERFSHQGRTLKKNDVKQLLALMERELIIFGWSSLMNEAYWSCYFYCCNNTQAQNYKILQLAGNAQSFKILNTTERALKSIPAYTASRLVIYLSGYITKGTISENIDNDLQYFFGNFIPDNAIVDEFVQAFQNIDAEIPVHREKMHKAYLSAPGDKPETANPGGAAFSEANKKGPEAYTLEEFEKPDKKKMSVNSTAGDQTDEKRKLILDAVHKDADKIKQQASQKAEKILDDAYKDADKIKQKASQKAEKIIDDAREEAEKIKQRASLETKKNISRANMDGDNPSQAFAEEQQRLQQNFSEVRSALLQANEMIRRLEDSVSETATKKISTKLLELYNLIADSRDSAFVLSKKNNDHELENIAYNMDVFLDMIIEFMADYGIQTIASALGDKFSAKHHEIETDDKQFDPRSAIVKVSKRNGFLWGEQVLQKERVEI